MKIAFLTHLFPPAMGGMQKWNQQLAEIFSLLGHQVTVLHLKDGAELPELPEPPLYQYFPLTINLNWREVEKKHPPLTLLRILKIIFLVIFKLPKLLRHDLWVVSFGESLPAKLLLSCWSRLFRKPYLCVVGNIVFTYPYREGVEKKIKFALARFILKGAATILVDGKDLQRELAAHGIPETKIVICYAGVDADRFTPEAAGPDSKPTTIDKPVVLYCARMAVENNPEVFLQAVAGLEGVQLMMVGDGELREPLMKKYEQANPPVNFVASVDYNFLPVILRQTRVAVYPFSNRIGGISQIIPLTMACGTPVIATRVGDNEELIENEINGILVEPDDLEAIRRELDNLLGDEKLSARLGKAGRQTIVDHWQMKSRHELYGQILDHIKN